MCCRMNRKYVEYIAKSREGQRQVVEKSFLNLLAFVGPVC